MHYYLHNFHTTRLTHLDIKLQYGIMYTMNWILPVSVPSDFAVSSHIREISETGTATWRGFWNSSSTTTASAIIKFSKHKQSKFYWFDIYFNNILQSIPPATHTAESLFLLEEDFICESSQFDLLVAAEGTSSSSNDCHKFSLTWTWEFCESISNWVIWILY